MCRYVMVWLSLRQMIEEVAHAWTAENADRQRAVVRAGWEVSMFG